MRSRMLTRLVEEIIAKIGTGNTGVSTLPVLAVDNGDNTVTLGTAGGDLSGVSAQSGYIPEVGHQATIIRNGMDLIVLPPQGPMTSEAPAATTGLTVTPGIQMLVCKWDEAPEADVKNNRGFYQIQSATDEAMTVDVQAHIVAATSAVLSPVTAARWVQVRAIDEAGYPGPYCAAVQGTPGTVPVSEPADGSITAAKLADAAVTAAKLANGAVDNLALAADAVESDNIATGAVVADSIQAGAVGAAAIAAYSVSTNKLAAGAVTANELAANAVTTAKLAAGSVTASILDANAINGKTITGATIRTGSSGTYVELDSGSPQAISFVVPGYSGGQIWVNGSLLEIIAPNGSGSQILLSAQQVSVAATLDRNGSEVWARDDLYVVQVAFTTNGTAPYLTTVSYSCPFYPTKGMAMVNSPQGAAIYSMTSIGQYSCALQAAQLTGASLGSQVVYATLFLSA